MRVKKLLSKVILLEQFGFLEGRQIHDAVGATPEGIHSIKMRKLSAMVAKLDLSKAYDYVFWLSLRMLLIHIDFTLNVVNWIMACVTYVSFAVLVNGLASPFFTPGKRLCQGCPLPPYLFLPVAEGLSHVISEAKRIERIKSIKIGEEFLLTHLLFIDDVLLFTNGSLAEGRALQEILNLYKKATGLVIDSDKSLLCFNEVENR